MDHSDVVTKGRAFLEAVEELTARAEAMSKQALESARLLTEKRMEIESLRKYQRVDAELFDGKFWVICKICGGKASLEHQTIATGGEVSYLLCGGCGSVFQFKGDSK